MFNLQDFVRECQAAMESPNPAREIEALVRDAIANPAAVREAFETSGGIEQHGPIRFAYRGEELSVADVTTPPGLKSPAHNHNMWAVIGVYDGQEHNRFFHSDEGGAPRETGERLLEAGDVVVLAPEAIHAIANPAPTVP